MSSWSGSAVPERGRGAAAEGTRLAAELATLLETPPPQTEVRLIDERSPPSPHQGAAQLGPQGTPPRQVVDQVAAVMILRGADLEVQPGGGELVEAPHHPAEQDRTEEER